MPAKAKRKSTKKAPAHRSFVPAKETQPFFVFKVTRQTLYWLILAVLVLALGAWVLVLNIRIQNIYDQIDANSNLVNTIPVKKK